MGPRLVIKLVEQKIEHCQHNTAPPLISGLTQLPRFLYTHTPHSQTTPTPTALTLRPPPPPYTSAWLQD